MEICGQESCFDCKYPDCYLNDNGTLKAKEVERFEKNQRKKAEKVKKVTDPVVKARNNPDKKKEYNRNYYASHKSEIDAYRKKYYKKYKKENAEKVKERAREYRETHREYFREYSKKYYQEHKKEPKPRVTLSEEEVIRRRKAGQRAYYLKHREELLAKRKVSYAGLKLQKGDLRQRNDTDDSLCQKAN